MRSLERGAVTQHYEHFFTAGLAISGDGERAMAVGMSGVWRWTEAAGPRVVPASGFNDITADVASDATLAALADDDGLLVVDFEHDEPTRLRDVRCQTVAVAPDGGHVICAQDTTMTVYDRGLRAVAAIDGWHGGYPYFVDLDHVAWTDNQLLTVADVTSDEVRGDRLDRAHGRDRGSELIADSQYRPSAVAVTASHVAIGRMGGGLDLVSQLGAPPVALTGHLATVRALDFSADGQTLYSGGEDAMVWEWDVASGRGRELGRHASYVRPGVARRPVAHRRRRCDVAFLGCQSQHSTQPRRSPQRVGS